MRSGFLSSSARAAMVFRASSSTWLRRMRIARKCTSCGSMPCRKACRGTPHSEDAQQQHAARHDGERGALEVRHTVLARALHCAGRLPYSLRVMRTIDWGHALEAKA